MEMLKKRMRTNVFKGRAVTQITLDDDFNVPDIRPDMEKVVEECGDIKITEVRVLDSKVSIHGKLEFAVLYVGSADTSPMHHLEGVIDFDEIVSMENVSDGDDVKVSWDMEDLRTSLINSRKLGVRSVVSLTLSVGTISEVEAVEQLPDAGDVCIRTQRLDTSQIHMRKKDTFRIKDEISVPGNKPNMREILWSNAMLNNLEIRLLDERISLKGEVGVFVMYASEEEKNPLQFFNTDVGFSGNLECHGATQEMIGHITAKIVHSEIEARKDADMEVRNVSVEVVLELDMAVYEDLTVEVLQDTYALDRMLTPKLRTVVLDNILMKNQTNVRLSQRMKIENHPSGILQICQAVGHIKVDRTQVNEDGILVEGVVYVRILYVAEDDRMPVNAIKDIVPFSAQIEIPGIDKNCTYDISPVLEQVNPIMSNSDEIELKMMLVLSSIVFKREQAEIVEDIEEAPFPTQMQEKLPGFVGYIVRPGDDLWTLAKRFHTTAEEIMADNDLESERLKAGQKLVLMRAAVS